MPRAKQQPKVKAKVESRAARGNREWQARIMLDGIMLHSPWFGTRKDAQAWGARKEELANAPSEDDDAVR